MLHDRVNALQTANIYERHRYRHIVGLPVIEDPEMMASPQKRRSWSRALCATRTDLFATGIYLDRIRDEGGRLRFAERHVVSDSSRFDTLLAIPL
jgi:hypothetical protein